MLTGRIPFNPKTAQNGDVLAHRTWGSVVYVGKHPTKTDLYVVWDRVSSCFRIVTKDSMVKEVEMVEKWMNLSTDLDNGGLIPSILFDTRQQAEKYGDHTLKYVCTVSIMVPKV